MQNNHLPIKTPTRTFNRKKAKQEELTKKTNDKNMKIDIEENKDKRTLQQKFMEWHKIITDTLKKTIPIRNGQIIQSGLTNPADKANSSPTQILGTNYFTRMGQK